MRAKSNSSKSGAGGKRPLASRDKVRAHRIRLRAQGLRPVTMWVPDTRTPAFAAAARKQCLRANRSPHAERDQAWVDAMSDWTDY